MVRIFMILAIVVLLKVGCTPVEASVGQEFRLPSHLKPLNYKITLEPDLNTNAIQGSMIATIMTSQSVNELVLNVEDVNILGSPRLSGRVASSLVYNRTAQTVTIGFNKPIPPGVWELWIEFTAKINAALAGVFRVSSPVMPREAYVLTHFEPTDARKAFPCWDEPALKATFDLTIVAPANLLVLSNAPMVSQRPLTSRPGMAEFQFARTPLMSTYLLAFVIGRFDYLETVDSNGVKIRIYTPVGRKDEGQFSLAIANKTLPYYAKLFGMDYPLPKMDVVSVPDFPSLAMENWGLVLAHEPSVLVTRDTPWSARTFTAITVMHELAHQWFGNLVSPRWWSDLWLNEGFATWVSFITAEVVVPELRILDQFYGMEKFDSMLLDAMEASHSIEAKVENPSDAAEVFDMISYGKGAAVVGMLHDWLGHERFFAGLRLYLSRHRFANAATEDLWSAMQEATGEPVPDVMRDWTGRKGFPVIGASIEWDEERGSCVLQLEQRRYRLPGADRPERGDRLWRVPVTVATEDGGAIKRVMIGARMSLALPTCGWAMLNPNSAGYYRAFYDADLMSDLTREAAAGDSGRISPAGRLTLIEDVFAMHAANLVWAEDALRAVELMRRDPSLQVWSAMLSHLYSLGAAIKDDGATLANWHRYLGRMCSSKMDEFGWDTGPRDPPDAGGWRSLLVTCLNRAGDARVTSWAKALFPRWVNNTRPKSVSPDLWREVCSISVSSGGGPVEFKQVLGALNRSDSIERRVSVLGCLSDFSGSGFGDIDEQLMALALVTELQSTDAMRLIEGLNPDMVWRLLTTHWDAMVRRFQGPYMLKRLVDRMDFSSAEGAARISRFFRRHTAIGVRSMVRRKVEEAALRAERISMDTAEMRYLVDNVLATGGWGGLDE